MNRVIIVASHRRSGTHLALDSLRRNALGIDHRFMTLERIEPGHPKHLPVAEFERRLRGRKGTVLVKSHALPGGASWANEEAGEYATQLHEQWPVLYVHRDGRDVLVSLYHFVASYAPNVAAQSIAEFIRTEGAARDAVGISRAAYWQRHALAWLDRNPAASVPFERMKADLAGAMTELAGDLGIRLRSTISPVQIGERRTPEPAWLRPIRRGLGLLGLARRPRPSTAIRPRSGRTGDWRAAFSEDDIAWFETQAGEAMRRLGYAEAR